LRIASAHLSFIETNLPYNISSYRALPWLLACGAIDAWSGSREQSDTEVIL
jgi:hypothetical protein